MGVPIGAVHGGRRGQLLPVPRPDRPQHQHRGTLRVPQQVTQPGRHPLTGQRVAGQQVELGLVQPHHRARPDLLQPGEERLGTVREDRMPQPPPGRQGVDRLPARPRLARRGPTDQHHDQAVAAQGPRQDRRKTLVVLPRDVGRQDRQLRRPGRDGDLDRPVHLQGERISELADRPPRGHAHPRLHPQRPGPCRRIGRIPARLTCQHDRDRHHVQLARRQAGRS